MAKCKEGQIWNQKLGACVSKSDKMTKKQDQELEKTADKKLKAHDPSYKSKDIKRSAHIIGSGIGGVVGGIAGRVKAMKEGGKKNFDKFSRFPGLNPTDVGSAMVGDAIAQGAVKIRDTYKRKKVKRQLKKKLKQIDI